MWFDQLGETAQRVTRETSTGAKTSSSALKNSRRAAAQLKAAGKRVVLCHGVFDLLHYGHILHFEEARRQGDVLVVTITPDIYVNKGPNRPEFPESYRAQMLAALEMVEAVAINRWPTAVETAEDRSAGRLRQGSRLQEPSGRLERKNRRRKKRRSAMQAARVYYTDDIAFSSSTS